MFGKVERRLLIFCNFYKLVFPKLGILNLPGDNLGVYIGRVCQELNVLRNNRNSSGRLYECNFSFDSKSSPT